MDAPHVQVVNRGVRDGVIDPMSAFRCEGGIRRSSCAANRPGDALRAHESHGDENALKTVNEAANGAEGVRTGSGGSQAERPCQTENKRDLQAHAENMLPRLSSVCYCR